jgi:hypothetical protein
MKLKLVLMVTLGLLSHLCLANSATPYGKIYFLSSIDESSLKGPFYLHWGFFQHYISSLEGQFTSHFRALSSTRELAVVRNANRADLFDALRDPQAIGVFWVSHGNPMDIQVGGGVLEVNSKLLDSTGADVAELFKSISPNIRWISVVSCDSNQILRAEQVEDSRIQGFSNLTDAHVGLAQSLSKSDSILNRPIEPKPACPQELGIPLTIKRTYRLSEQMPTDYIFPAITVENQKTSLGSFHPVSASKLRSSGGMAVESQTIWLPISGPSDDLNIIFQSGLSSGAVPSYFELGSFSIDSGIPADKWLPFEDMKTHTPFGVTWEPYLSRNKIDIHQSAQLFTPRGCGPVGK